MIIQRSRRRIVAPLVAALILPCSLMAADDIKKDPGYIAAEKKRLEANEPLLVTTRFYHVTTDRAFDAAMATAGIHALAMHRDTCSLMIFDTTREASGGVWDQGDWLHYRSFFKCEDFRSIDPISRIPYGPSNTRVTMTTVCGDHYSNSNYGGLKPCGTYPAWLWKAFESRLPR